MLQAIMLQIVTVVNPQDLHYKYLVWKYTVIKALLWMSLFVRRKGPFPTTAFENRLWQPLPTTASDNRFWRPLLTTASDDRLWRPLLTTASDNRFRNRRLQTRWSMSFQVVKNA